MRGKRISLIQARYLTSRLLNLNEPRLSTNNYYVFSVPTLLVPFYLYESASYFTSLGFDTFQACLLNIPIPDSVSSLCLLKILQQRLNNHNNANLLGKQSNDGQLLRHDVKLYSYRYLPNLNCECFRKT